MKNVSKYQPVLAVVLTFLFLLVVGCTAATTGGGLGPDQPVSSDDPTPTPTETPAGEFTYGQAMVEGIDILLLESFPVQIHVVATGHLADGCTVIDEAQVTQTDATFQVNLTTRRPVDQICTQALVPFEETIPLDVLGLTAGTYTVNVNGVTGSFTLDVDNVLLQE